MNQKKQVYKRSPTKKIKIKVAHGIIHIHSTFNNTIITLTNQAGDTLSQSSPGTIGYKGKKKSTPYAAQLAMAKILTVAKQYHMVQVDIRVKGIGPGRNSALRSLEGSWLKLLTVSDLTPIPHNGCRPPKKPRV